MKDLKFRVWLKQEKKMVGVSALYFDFEGVDYVDGVGDDHFKYLDEVELMLGLKIYDEIIFIGDIVRIYGGEQTFGYYEFDKVKVIKDLEDLVMLSNLDGGIEVIGNIYENPELLKKEI